jgi:hypothetical protein
MATKKSTKKPSAANISGVKPLNEKNSDSIINVAWLLAMLSVVILIVSVFSTSLLAPFGAALGAYALYVGIRLKTSQLIIAGSVGLLNVVVYIVMLVRQLIGA